MTFVIRMTRKDGEWFKEYEAVDGMDVHTHIAVDIRKTGYQKSDPEIGEVRYHEKGTKEYRYA